MAKSVLDSTIEKIISRKLVVFVIATILMVVGAGLESETWGWIAMVYIGTQGAVDMVRSYKFENPMLPDEPSPDSK